MRILSETEKISLAAVIKMESDGLLMQRAINMLTSDEDLQTHSESSILATEGIIKAMQQFIVENEILISEEV